MVEPWETVRLRDGRGYLKKRGPGTARQGSGTKALQGLFSGEREASSGLVEAEGALLDRVLRRRDDPIHDP